MPLEWMDPMEKQLCSILDNDLPTMLSGGQASLERFRQEGHTAADPYLQPT